MIKMLDHLVNSANRINKQMLLVCVMMFEEIFKKKNNFDY